MIETVTDERLRRPRRCEARMSVGSESRPSERDDGTVQELEPEESSGCCANFCGPGPDVSATEDLARARPLVLALINQTHRNRPLENVEALALFGSFQEAAGIPVDPFQFASYMSAHSAELDQFGRRPWLWLVANARNAALLGDDLFVAHALYWTFAWKNYLHERFRVFLTRAMLTIDGVPPEVLHELHRLASVSLPRLPQDQVLFGDDTGQVTVGLLANVVGKTFG